jgi:hypothetical protein
MFVGCLQRMWAPPQRMWARGGTYLQTMWAQSRLVCGPEGLRLWAATVTQPFEEYLQIYFTREEVLGYATGETKAAVQNKIRTDLEAHIRIRDSHQ